MKTSLAHLPPRKQEELAALVALLREAGPVERVCREKITALRALAPGAPGETSGQA